MNSRIFKYHPVGRSAFLLISLTLVFTSCSNPDVTNFPKEQWQMFSATEDTGWSAHELKRADHLANSIGTAAYMLVYKGNVVHTYGDVARRYRCHSIRKSILSSLYGIYINEGLIDLDEDMQSIGIDQVDSLNGYELQVKVRNLLSCTSGIYHPGSSETQGMIDSRPERLSAPLDPPFYYNNWDFNTLGTIFRLKTGENIFEAFQKKIAEPLQMQDFRLKDGFYEYDPEHSGSPEYKFKLSSRDLARFGLLFLENGKWQDNQIVPASWVEESTSKKIDVDERYGLEGFGYCWWTMGQPFDRYNGFLTSGYHGHRLVILPELDLIFVHRMNTYTSDIADNKQIFALLQMLLDARNNDRVVRNPVLKPMPDSPPAEKNSVVSCEKWMEKCGEYVSNKGKLLIVSCEKNTLWMQDKLAGNYRLLPIDSLTFLVEDMQKEIRFEDDIKSKETTLVFGEVFKKQNN